MHIHRCTTRPISGQVGRAKARHPLGRREQSDPRDAGSRRVLLVQDALRQRQRPCRREEPDRRRQRRRERAGDEHEHGEDRCATEEAGAVLHEARDAAEEQRAADGVVRGEPAGGAARRRVGAHGLRADAVRDPRADLRAIARPRLLRPEHQWYVHAYVLLCGMVYRLSQC